ncbi:MAG: DUF502 domain-containing protein [Acidobacteriota bacterium]
MRGLSHFRKAFLTGLLVIFPLLITIWLLSLLFAPIQHFATPPVVAILRWLGLGALLDLPGAGVGASLIGLLLTAIFIYLVGVLGSNIIGRSLVRGLDNLALSIPLVKSIYGSARQLLETFGSPARTTFEGVVMIEYPRQGFYMVGLVTSETAGELRDRTSQNLVNVFVPTTPNPTSGVLVMVARESLIPLEMTVEEALRLIVSGGIVAPVERQELESTSATS